MLLNSEPEELRYRDGGLGEERVAPIVRGGERSRATAASDSPSAIPAEFPLASGHLSDPNRTCSYCQLPSSFRPTTNLPHSGSPPPRLRGPLETVINFTDIKPISFVPAMASALRRPRARARCTPTELCIIVTPPIVDSSTMYLNG